MWEEEDRAVREGRSSPTEGSGKAALTDARGGIQRGRWGREETVPVWGIEKGSVAATGAGLRLDCTKIR